MSRSRGLGRSGCLLSRDFRLPFRVDAFLSLETLERLRTVAATRGERLTESLCALLRADTSIIKESAVESCNPTEMLSVCCSNDSTLGEAANSATTRGLLTHE